VLGAIEAVYNKSKRRFSNMVSLPARPEIALDVIVVPVCTVVYHVGFAAHLDFGLAIRDGTASILAA
jgi:hypothetical protein